MARKNIELKTINDDVMHGYAWEVSNAKGVVIVVTGMEEHAMRYDEFANFLNKNGYNVYSIDHYGQGANCPTVDTLGIVPRSFFSKSVRNFDDLAKKYEIKGKPLIIFGHSMGSFMVQDYIQRFAKHPTKAIICGTNGQNGAAAYKVGYPLARLICKIKGEKKQAKLLKSLAVGGYAKSVKNRKTEADWLSYNDESNRKYINDPYCGHPSSNGFYREFLKGDARLYNKKFLNKIRKDLPILLIAGKDDPVGAFGKGPTKLHELYTKKLGLKNVELKVYEGMRHEILNEVDHEKVYKDVLEFIEK